MKKRKLKVIRIQDTVGNLDILQREWGTILVGHPGLQ